LLLLLLFVVDDDVVDVANESNNRGRRNTRLAFHLFVFNVIEIVLIAGFKSCLSYFFVAVVVVVEVVV
jgi:hypothetical protein